MTRKVQEDKDRPSENMRLIKIEKDRLFKLAGLFHIKFINMLPELSTLRYALSLKVLCGQISHSTTSHMILSSTAFSSFAVHL